MTKLLVTGGREFEDVDFMVDALAHAKAYCDGVDEKGLVEVITGEARGADTIAKEWAEVMEIPHTGFPCTDSHWKQYGKRAGLIRNEHMLDYGPDVVISFPGGTGTEHMVKISKEVPWITVIECRRVYFSKEDGDYGFLSNFATGLDFADEDGLWWRTSEHYYQAQKSVDPDEQFAIQDAPTPRKAKERGQAVKFKRDDWNNVKLDVMRKAIRLKFAKGSKAAELLKETGFDYLIEYAPWGDTFWGVNGSKVGHNHLGRILNERKFQL